MKNKQERLLALIPIGAHLPQADQVLYSRWLHQRDLKTLETLLYRIGTYRTDKARHLLSCYGHSMLVKEHSQWWLSRFEDCALQHWPELWKRVTDGEYAS